jgi:hypothetical protein
MYGFSQCFLKHCYLCGTHHGHSARYCLACLNERYNEVERDAKIRAITSDQADHRYWSVDHPDTISEG